ncbi:MAG: trimeric intracellular cation channel family protein [Cardiobacteriaceae bacterium]|nr:trimeric intracellular cation channel family protein [Cardiobacteriaceae bacterium]
MFSHNFIYILDLIGCIACAAAAASLAKKVGLDFLGAIMIAAIGAIGGGTCRDLLIDRHPLFWLIDLNYLIVVSITAITVQIFYYQVEKFFARPLVFFDAIGLAAFAVIGFEAALSKGFAYPIVVLMGVVTAVNGGIMRDIVCRQIPLVLREEIYITCAICGGIVFLILLKLDCEIWLRDIVSLSVTFLLRLLAIKKKWNLPSITIAEKKHLKNQ